MSTARSRPAPTSATDPLRATRLARRRGAPCLSSWQFDPADRQNVVISTASSAYHAISDRPGVHLLPLFCDSCEDVRLERWSPGATVTLKVPGGAEVLVLDGAFDEGGEHFDAQSWLRLPVGGVLQAKAGASGCSVWVKTGHLLRIEGIIQS